VGPLAGVLIFFSKDAMFAWTGDAATVHHVWLVTSMLVAGTALNGIMNVPYALQVAHGWTRLTIWMNGIAVAVLVPAVYLLGTRFGSVGAAAGWLALNLGYVLVGVQLMHRKLLLHEKAAWYARDVALPLGTAMGTALLLRAFFVHPAPGRLGAVAVLFAVSAATFVATLAATPECRRALRSRWSMLPWGR
jgi:O-antigen/teichoic acid export membrane protein